MRRIADCHVHIRNGRYDEITSMLDDMNEMGVTDAALQALPFRSISENISALSYKMNYKKINLAAFGGLHLTDRYATIPYEKQAEKLLELGCDGIKLIDMSPSLYEWTKTFVSNPKYDRMLSMLEERNVPLLLHSNDPKECWEKKDPNTCAGLALYQEAYFGHDASSYEQLYYETIKMLDKHPKLNIIIAHFFFLSSNIDRAEYVMEKYPNLRLDLTPGTDMYFHFIKKPEIWHDFFTRYQDRIFFGTDCNTYKDFNKGIIELVYEFISHDYSDFKMPCYGEHIIQGLSLSDSVVEKISYSNYMNFIGNKVKDVNAEKMYDMAEQTLKLMKDTPEDPIYDAASKIITDLARDPKQEIAINVYNRVLSER